MINNFKFLKIVLLGFGFLSISLLWSLYNTDIPVILQKSYKISSFAVGWIMNLDNILALFLIPLIGALSDRTWTKLGKRMPYIITSLPLGAIFFSFIPWIPALFGINTSSLILLILVILLMNIFQAIGRGPVISLMPDLVPPENRSPANGIINFMGGLGSLIAYFIVGKISAVNRTLGFSIAGLIQIVSVWIIFLAINESKDSLVMTKVERENNEFSFKKLINLKDKNLIFLLLAIFFWFIGFNAVETFYSVYMALEKGLDPTLGESIAKSNLGILALTFMIFSIPSGLIAKKIGRKNTIIIGLLGMIFIFIGLISFQNLSIIRIFFMLGGLFWALININSLPMVLDLGDLKSQGTYTGFYYFSSQFASIVAPPFAGFLADLLKTRFVIFPLGGIFFTLSLLMMLQIKMKEPKEKEN
ncbi:SLC45 family MFS transporter [Dictyoglomus thermophilum]|uniref:Permeases of the major facilitator superfamily n=1 Tax=Dictyoglomus thermophilum (strain ATCC 35947 / DSM 3960 / H-6-12) TaxID=309799 RepID=B5YBW9_DICT6|nr:SLC45 family MFS transporter [Dictyoglomus thermophilum]ACI18950.1 permeases of the major facilitator superfamily [Dictyoglomus thermophilum H-6-12]MCX7720788.1 SLC45 family MFS transporter [Dictyoglomus thermophilum]